MLCVCVCVRRWRRICGGRLKRKGNEWNAHKSRLNSQVRQGSQAGYKMFCTNGKVVTETLERKKEKTRRKNGGPNPNGFRCSHGRSLYGHGLLLYKKQKTAPLFFLFFDFTGYPRCVSAQFFSFSIPIRLGKNKKQKWSTGDLAFNLDWSSGIYLLFPCDWWKLPLRCQPSFVSVAITRGGGIVL